MMVTLHVALAVLVLGGHWALWAAAVNNIHANPMPRPLLRTLTAISLPGMCVIVPVALLVVSYPAGWEIVARGEWSQLPWAFSVYAIVCLIAAGAEIFRRAWRRFVVPFPAVLRSNHTIPLDIGRERAELFDPPRWQDRAVLRLPGNEALCLDVREKTIIIPRLDPTLDGLIIAHLSDLHFSGRIGKAFFDEVMEQTNAMQADLIAITGDLVDKRPCIDWIPDTLGQLKSRHGVYYVLGNHDKRVPVVELRNALKSAGLIDVGGRWQTLKMRGKQILLAGNELPWFGPAADMSKRPALDREAPPLTIALVHTPDQYGWAKRNDFDLMLAGHTHGGQVQLPLIGAVFAPSRHGVKYASGTFHEVPTVMHVSQGVSSLLPLRWNCRPELAKLVLRSASAVGE
jgi:predicted MPP superfamily phosphohydrolase